MISSLLRSKTVLGISSGDRIDTVLEKMHEVKHRIITGDYQTTIEFLRWDCNIFVPNGLPVNRLSINTYNLGKSLSTESIQEIISCLTHFSGSDIALIELVQGGFWNIQLTDEMDILVQFLDGHFFVGNIGRTYRM